MGIKIFDRLHPLQAERIDPGVLKEGTVPWLLARHGPLLFPEHLFMGWRGESVWGRKAWPAQFLMGLLVLRFCEPGLSRRGTIRRLSTDLEWKGALGLPVGESPPDESRLRAFEKFLQQNHPQLNKPRALAVHEHIVKQCQKYGVVDPRNALWGTDGTAMHCYGAITDSIDSMGRGLKKLLQTWAQGRRISRYSAAKQLDLMWLHRAKSIKGAFQGGVRTPRQKDKAVTKLAIACLETAQLVYERINEVRPSLRKRLLRTARHILRVVWLDLDEKEDGTFQIAQRTAPDRLVSITDPQARHGHKSKCRPFDGFKLVILGEFISGLVASVAVIPANRSEGIVGLRLMKRAKALFDDIERVLGDSDFRAMDLRVKAESLLQIEVLSPPARADSTRTKKKYGKKDFDIDFDAMTATCPAGHVSGDWRLVNTSHNKQKAPRFRWPLQLCESCPLKQDCPKERKWHRIILHPHEQKLRQLRHEWQHGDARKHYKRRCELERLVFSMTRHGARRAMAWGIHYALFQSQLIATRVNLALLAKKLAQEHANP